MKKLYQNDLFAELNILNEKLYQMIFHWMKIGFNIYWMKNCIKMIFHWMQIEFNMLNEKIVSTWSFTEWKLNLIYWMKKCIKMILVLNKNWIKHIEWKTVSTWFFTQWKLNLIYWMKKLYQNDLWTEWKLN